MLNNILDSANNIATSKTRPKNNGCWWLMLPVLILLGGLITAIYFAIKFKQENQTCICPGSETSENIPKGPYQVVDNLRGIDLDPKYGHFEYFTGADPTHGSVNYDKHEDLLVPLSKGSLQINIGNIEKFGEVHRAIRLTSKKSYQKGLFIIDMQRMPAGAGLWPAWWLTSAENGATNTWACGGEIDIMESVNSDNHESVKSWAGKNTYNAATLHTNELPDGSKCMQDGILPEEDNDCQAPGGNIDKACGCNYKEGGDKNICPYKGCGYKFPSDNSAGYKFNEDGGGVYAMELTYPDNQVTIWFWSRKDPLMPKTWEQPDPSHWKTQEGNSIKFKPCPGHFKNLKMVLNTTLCGDWAGSVWNGPSGDYAQIVQNKKDCHGAVTDPNYNDRLVKNGSWIINWIRVYEKD